ncbi:N-6 DNA methylase [Lentilitoribacter sp. Alg239-R112]|uniref:N-6 DNA methylase n=1 Tax=Lentilitoribacter sp. Alg239-R112 TaxID=2305987 RepID=UPI0013A6D919|nr:N-6 DNA methylase [Lentilitoribacter sp. Alg239-R112]
MAVKKTELYASLWASCDELRGGMDASQYKNYILTLLFVKYVSDKYANEPYGAIVIPEGGSFADMATAVGQAGIGDKMNTIVGALADANDMAWLKSADNDFNNDDRLGKGKAMVDTLSKLVRIFEGLDLGRNQADGDDLMGDAYEYLMRHFATESGKSKGQFYTPAEVSTILAKVIGIGPDTNQDQTAYDPTCGSGSLLLKVNAEAPNGLSLRGQEKEQATSALAKMNMVLHNSPTGEIWQDDTISAPHWLKSDKSLETFDFAVANPPFSLKSWSNGIVASEDHFNRFEYGEPPEKNGDYAFLLHIIKSLKSTGKGAVILPHGVLFRGNAEADIRRKLIHQGYIKGIIGLPANLFYGTGIPACIVVLDKQAAKENNPIFMIDASKGFVKDGNKNRLRSQDIHRIVDTFNNQLQVDRYSRLVPYTEIAQKNEFNLNIPRYIDASEPEDIHDLSAHLSGGIPNADIDALQSYWDVMPTLRTTLFADGDREGYSKTLVAQRDVKKSISEHPEFVSFKAETLERFTAWKARHRDKLNSIAKGDKPKELIFEISEDLLSSFAGANLLDKYDIYQILMTYWADQMQDDVYLLAQDGWDAASSVRQLVPIKDKNGKNVYKEDADFQFGKAKAMTKHKSDIIPPALVIARFFANEKAALDAATQAKEDATQALETFIEDNNGEDSLIAAALDDGKYKVADVKREAKAATDEKEAAALTKLVELQTAETAAKKVENAAIDVLDLAVFQKIPQLSADEAKALTVDDKWLATIEIRIGEEVERITQALASRVRVLDERYAQTLPELSGAVDDFSAKVEAHLKKMGLSW